jgi:thioredoxin reductase (NADPH)
VVEVFGEQKVSGLRRRDTVARAERTIEITGLFVAIGHDPRVELFKN